MSDATLKIIQRLDPDGWEHREPTDTDRARFRREVIIRFGSKAWTRYTTTNWNERADMPVPTSDKAGIRQVIRALRDAGYTLDSVDNGEEDVPVTTEAQAIEEATATDSARLYVKKPDGGLAFVFFVLGNSPEEVAADWNVSLDHVIEPLTTGWWDE